MIEKVILELPEEDYNFLMSTLQYVKDALYRSRFDGIVAPDDAQIIYNDVSELLNMLEIGREGEKKSNDCH
ncbi:MAG: hypothetical protein QXI19_02175 [Candidatus Caldarchaeum sp.]